MRCIGTSEGRGPVTHGGRCYKGFNFFAELDQRLFEVILRGEHTISGMRNRDIRRSIPDLSAAQVSRHLKRLRTHGLIKRVGRTYKYYLTKAGRTVALAGLKLRSLVLIPELATTPGMNTSRSLRPRDPASLR